LLPWLIEVNEPTAYMVPPHCTSCFTTSLTFPVLFSCGVPRAACGDTARDCVMAAARAVRAAGAAPAGAAE
jgi:hypothetical protein